MNSHEPAELRLMCCEACGGDGGFEENCLSIGGYDSTEWTVCAACNGRGEVEVELQPLTADDAESWASADQSWWDRHRHEFEREEAA